MQGWECDLSNFDLAIFSIAKKIDCDRIDLINYKTQKNDRFDREKYFDSVSPLYAKRSNRSCRSSLFFED